ncbi:MAG: efflux RND transporter periplasmic adaptor subunit [Gammaproteobacteria bacterium]|jgi:RND family efflux transporter MFP subunit|nr:efflux RND transporter periplasmic adaptor subunit [Gammaproteobacteria bacterium]
MTIPGPRRAAILLLLAAGWLAAPASSATLTLTEDEVRNLGIDLAAPQDAEAAGSVDARGRVVIPPAGDVAVSAAYEGLVVRLLRVAGDRVVAGDVIAEINSPPFLDAQRAFLDALTADELARRRLNRDRQLVAEGIVSERRLEQTEAEAAAASAARSEHRQMLHIGGLDEAFIDRLAASRKLLPLLPVRAPLNGVVLELSARVGAGVSPMESLFRLGDLSTLWLEMRLPQQLADSVGEGMTVSVAPAAEPVARIIAIGGAVAPDTQMVTVRAEVEAANHGLRPGQFVAARIATAPAGEVSGRVWAVPAASVIQAGDGHFVFVRTAGGFEVAQVQPVGSSGDHALVAAELDPGARLASAGVSALKSLWGGPAAGES